MLKVQDAQPQSCCDIIRLVITCSRSCSAALIAFPATTMSNYPVPPPGYGSTNAQQGRSEVHEPLLGGSSRDESGGFYNQPAPGELPDDFKACLVLRCSSFFASDFPCSTVCLFQRALLRLGAHSSAKSTRFSVSSSFSIKFMAFTYVAYSVPNCICEPLIA